jgi:hypothetical protein
MLQISSTQTDAVAAQAEPGMLSSSTFGVEFLIHATFIWIALIIISMIVFAYRRRRNCNGERGFPETYQDDLDAMRKGRSDDGVGIGPEA